MKLADLECPDCGRSNRWLMDASIIRERDFEGMFFEIVEDDGKIVVRGLPEDKEYLDDFNMKKIAREAAEDVEDWLAYRDLANIYCPTCKESLE